MISLTYFSTAVEELTPADLETLLQLSRLNNSAMDLTGVLFFAGGYFVQTLEGEEDAVDRVYAAIEQDPRHRDLLVAVREFIGVRDFPDWSMGYQRVSPEDARCLPGFNDYLEGAGESTQDRLSHARIFHRVFREQSRKLLGDG